MESQAPPRSSARSRASSRRTSKDQLSVDQLPTPVDHPAVAGKAPRISTSGKSGSAPNAFHSGALHKVGLQLASKIRLAQGKGKGKVDAIQPAKLEITVTEKGSSSLTLSSPLRELQRRMSETKKSLKTLDVIDSASVYDVVNQWENALRRTAHNFEKAEEQRIIDLSAAIDRDEKRDQLHKQELAAKDTELAEAVEQCMEQLAKSEADNAALRKDLEEYERKQSKSDSNQPAVLKNEYESIIKKQVEQMKSDTRKKYTTIVARQLEAKDDQMKMRLQTQRDKMEAEFERRLTALKQEYDARRTPGPLTPPSTASPKAKVEQSSSPLQPLQPSTSIKQQEHLSLSSKRKRTQGDNGLATTDTAPAKKPRTMLPQVERTSKTLSPSTPLGQSSTTPGLVPTARTSNSMKSRVPNITKIEATWSTTYHGIPRWKAAKGDMIQDEIRELSPLYNPARPPSTFSDLPQWTTVGTNLAHDEADELFPL